MKRIFIVSFLYLSFFSSACFKVYASPTKAALRDAFVGMVPDLLSSKGGGGDNTKDFYANTLRANIRVTAEAIKVFDNEEEKEEMKDTLKKYVRELNERTGKPFVQRLGEDIDDNLFGCPSGCIDIMCRNFDRAYSCVRHYFFPPPPPPPPAANQKIE